MFAIIQDKQQRPMVQVPCQRVGQGAARLLRHTHGRRHGLGDERGVGDGCQFGGPHPIGEILQRLRRCLEGQPGLASPSGAGEGQKTSRGQESLDLGDLALPPDEAG